MRIAGDEKLRQHHEVAGVLLCHALDCLDSPGQTGVSVERPWVRLHHGNLAGVLDASHRCLRTGVGYLAGTIVMPRIASGQRCSFFSPGT